MIFWITFPNISIFLWISIIPEPSELTRGQTPCEPTILILVTILDLNIDLHCEQYNLMFHNLMNKQCLDNNHTQI